MSHVTAIRADQYDLQDDGSVWSKQYRHYVFDPARRLRPSEAARAERVLMMGFGAGVELLHLLRAHSERRDMISVTICEAHPPEPQSLRDLWSAVAPADDVLTQVLDQWPEPVAGLHRLQCRPKVQTHVAADTAKPVDLTLAFGNPAQLLGELTGPFDLVCFHSTLGGLSLAGGSNVRLAALRSLTSQAALLTGSTHQTTGGEGELRSLHQQLSRCGIIITQHDYAWYGRWREFRKQTARSPGFSPPATAGDVAVIGAGIAGISVAEMLARSGMKVTILEQHDAAISGGSAQPVLAGHLHFSRDDNLLARLSRAAQSLHKDHSATSAIGRLQLLPDSDAAQNARGMLNRLNLPSKLVSLVSAGQASELAGVPIRQPALWHSCTGLISPPSLLSNLPVGVEIKTGVMVSAIRADGAEWALIDCRGRAIIRARIIIVCTGAGPPAVTGVLGDSDAHEAALETKSIRTRLVAGQSTQLSDDFSARLRCIVGADAYACPLPDGSVLTGASYRAAQTTVVGSGALTGIAPELAADRQANLHAWRRLVGVPPEHACDVKADFVGYRHTTSDHLPIIGAIPNEHLAREHWADYHRDDRLPLPRLPNLYMAGGFGSRGGLWSALAATVLHDLILSSQPPIERSLMSAIAPDRFLRKAIRRYDTPDACTMLTPSDSPNDGHATRTIP